MHTLDAPVPPQNPSRLRIADAGQCDAADAIRWPVLRSEPTALLSPLARVSLWWSDLALEREEIAHVTAWLSAPEMERARRFGTSVLRDRYIGGRATLRFVLARTLGIEPQAVAIRRGHRGRPELQDVASEIDFNISHTEGGALIGIVDREHRGTRIGVDVERADRKLGAERLARKFLSPMEQATLTRGDVEWRRQRFLRFWTCKEAMSKATGDGLAAPFAQLTVDVEETPCLVAGPPPYTPDAWRLGAVAVPADFLATMALWEAPIARAATPR